MKVGYNSSSGFRGEVVEIVGGRTRTDEQWMDDVQIGLIRKLRSVDE